MTMSSLQVPERLDSALIREDPELRDLVEEFVDALPDRLQELREAVSQSNWAQARALAHRLKGAGGSFGYPVLSDVARMLEERFSAEQADDVDAFFADLSRIISAARNALREAV